jgi:hypothetical protein
MDYATPDVKELFRAAEILEMHGGWPKAGGWIDQTASVVQGVREITKTKKRLQVRYGT